MRAIEQVVGCSLRPLSLGRDRDDHDSPSCFSPEVRSLTFIALGCREPFSGVDIPEILRQWQFGSTPASVPVVEYFARSVVHVFPTELSASRTAGVSVCVPAQRFDSQAQRATDPPSNMRLVDTSTLEDKNMTLFTSWNLTSGVYDVVDYLISRLRRRLRSFKGLILGPGTFPLCSTFSETRVLTPSWITPMSSSVRLPCQPSCHRVPRHRSSRGTVRYHTP